MSTVPQKQETQVATASERRPLTPRVDIFEVEDGLGVVLDMPGGTKETVEVRVENDVLTIAGKACSSLPDTLLYREHELGDYFRQFQLTDHVDQDKIKADYKCGVLTVHLPKGEKAKPKQIKVSVTS